MIYCFPMIAGLQFLSNLEWVDHIQADNETAVLVRVDDQRAHCVIGEGAADTDVESRHNSYEQALLQRTQVRKISTYVIHAYFDNSH